ncbi:MAG: hypothetical protein R3D25_14100 [Geminicoccaceae bacterium]
MSLRGITVALAVLVGAHLGMAASQAQAAGKGQIAVIDGEIASAAADQGRFVVTLYRLRAKGQHGGQAVLARTVSDDSGAFHLTYRDRRDDNDRFLVTARRGVLLYAAVLPPGSEPESITVNELTTVATAFTLAQFISPRGVAGFALGIVNGVAMTGNFVDVGTGEVATVLATEPNGPATSTVDRFNALANVLAGCARQRAACFQLFFAASGETGRPPVQTLQAMVEIARNPWRNIDEVFALSQIAMPPYAPALDEAPSAWTLPIVFDGVNKGSGTEYSVINGPGNLAFDAQGSAWVGLNYQPSPGPGQENVPVCAGTIIIRFAPDGSFWPGSPYEGGGLDGVGFGTWIDTRGSVWASNFGFSGDGCPLVPGSDSVSAFTSEGIPISGDDGFTAGDMSWPQGIVSNLRGDIWIASCLNGNITVYPNGNPRRARVIPPATTGLEKPFAIAIDAKNRAWITSNKNSAVAVLDRRGRPLSFSPIDQAGAFDLPLDIAGDSKGNMWVSNSVVLEAPCPDGLGVPQVEGGSLTLIHPDGRIDPRGRFTGGGLSIPWGVAIDGRDTVWVASFGSQLEGVDNYIGRVSHFCGADASQCPPGFDTGDAISPATGYSTEALQRITGIAIDSTGNLWAVNNWTPAAPQTDPGGNSVVVFPGVAAPVKTPLIGPVVSAVESRDRRNGGSAR